MKYMLTDFLGVGLYMLSDRNMDIITGKMNNAGKQILSCSSVQATLPTQANASSRVPVSVMCFLEAQANILWGLQ